MTSVQAQGSAVHNDSLDSSGRVSGREDMTSKSLAAMGILGVFFLTALSILVRSSGTIIKALADEAPPAAFARLATANDWINVVSATVLVIIGVSLAIVVQRIEWSRDDA